MGGWLSGGPGDVHFLCHFVMALIAHLIRFRCEVIALTRLVTVSRDGGGGDEDGEDRR